MPTITRWFRVTHDINSDPEIWELRERYTDRAALVWLECLSIADRNSGVIGPRSDQTVNQLASKCRTTRAKVFNIVEWCLDRGWIAIGQAPDANPMPTRSRPDANPVSTRSAHDQYLRIANWRKYNKRRGDDESLSETSPSETPHPTPKEQAAKPAAPVDKVKEIGPKTDASELVNLAAEIGKLDKVAPRQTQHKLCQWTISMVRTLKKEPPERVTAVVRASLEAVRGKLQSGYEIRNLWGLLETIFNKERTKYMQGPENEGHKRAPLGQFGAILDDIRKGSTA